MPSSFPQPSWTAHWPAFGAQGSEVDAFVDMADNRPSKIGVFLALAMQRRIAARNS